MANLLRFLAVIAAIGSLGTMVTVFATWPAGQGPFAVLGRALDAGMIKFTLATVAWAVADLLKARDLPQSTTD